MLNASHTHGGPVLVDQPNLYTTYNIAPGSAYIQTNLASDITGLGQLVDPQLINPWGIAIRGTSPFWTATARHAPWPTWTANLSSMTRVSSCSSRRHSITSRSIRAISRGIRPAFGKTADNTPTQPLGR